MQETTNRKKENFEIDVQKLLFAYLRKWWLIALCAVVFAVAAVGYTVKFVTPMYRASVTIYVNNIRSGETINYISGSNLEASKQLVNTYVNIIRSDTVLNKVADTHNLRYNASQIRGMMSAEQMGETEIFKLHIVNQNPERAAEVANAIANVALAEIENFVEGSSTKVIDYAQVPTVRHTPSYSTQALKFGLVGALIAGLWITVRFLLDTRVNNTEELEMLFPYPVLGQIPSFDTLEARGKSGYGENEDETAKEAEKK